MEVIVNTKIEYLYRDADNYKVRNEVIIEGTITEHQKQIIEDCLDEGEYFIPHAVGLPERTLVDLGFAYREEADHPYFELSIGDISVTHEEPTECISVEEVVRNFVEAKGKWKEFEHK